jgi:3-oxoacyl-[acyl-carrier-protein] synthase-3
VTFGIVTVDYSLGEPYAVAEAAPGYTKNQLKVRTWGYRTFYRARDGVGLTDLATAAGQRALARADLPAGEVDLVVLAMADIPEHLYWDPAAATQAKLGAHRAEAVLVNQACSSGVVAFDTVAGKLATHPDYRLALLITANRVCEEYWNRMESSTAVMSDGAAAAIIVREHSQCQWLATEIISDGGYADFSYLPGGGAARPFSAGGPAPGQIGDPIELMEEFLGHNVRELIKFARHTRDNTRAALELACRRAAIPVDAVRYILHMNGTAKALRDFAREFGLPLENTNASIARDYGHFGSADQLLSFGKMLDEGRFRTGDVVALSSAGNGMHWACTLLRV